jgi:hypothetical protein
MWAGACPRWTNDSRTTLHVCSSAYRPGLDHRGVPPQASPPRPVAAEGAMRSRSIFHRRWRWRFGCAWVPMPLAIKRVMDIDRGIKVGICLVVTHWTQEQFSPFHCDALAVLVGEPLPLCAASGAILGCPMCIDLHGDGLVEVCFVFCLLIDFAA